MAIDPDAFRRALGSFATGVTVVTGIDAEGRPVGVTVNAFSSLSLDPPLVLVCLATTTGCLGAFSEGERFAVNILGAGQGALSDEFAGPQEHKFKGREFLTWESGCPILPDCLANLECTRVAVHEGGDHFIVVGRVDRIDAKGDGEPLVFYRSAYHRIGEG